MRMSESPPRILLVDDEDIVTTSIKSFLNLETDYEVVVFNSPRRALDYLGKAPVDLVVSDFLMPEMDGIQFLLEVKKLYPQTVRILLTGYADKENAIKAINEVGLYQYIEKPWDNEEVQLVIKNGLEKRLLLKRLQEKIGEVERAHEELRDVQKQILRAFV
jgi:response regulator RpfG family c-di-GMP phosphodiesterase